MEHHFRPRRQGRPTTIVAKRTLCKETFPEAKVSAANVYNDEIFDATRAQ
jgi:hypothetical protein